MSLPQQGPSPTDLSQVFDVIVIGGGITGVGVAREAVGRGLRTLLVDRGDFGGGTSAATTKYIHGGIRYLEQYDFGVVRESLRERRILALGAPHLVHQTQFIMPAWRWSKPSRALMGAGVALYDALSFDRNRGAPASLRIPHPTWLGKQRLVQQVPWLDTDGLQGGFAYHDTLNVHPERLLLAYVKSAAADGASFLTHTEVTGFVQHSDRGNLVIDGVTARDRLGGVTYTLRARVVVNAAGPWIDRVLQPLGRSLGVAVNRSKGVHVLTRPLGGPGRVDAAVFARAKSGKHVIVSPWMGGSFIGPTDTALPDGSDAVVADADDVDSILTTVNSTMNPGERALTVDDVVATTVGLRPLIRRGEQGDGGNTYSASRRHELYHHVDRGVTNLWSIGGGKWTTARATGEQMVDALLKHELRGVPTRRFDSERSGTSTTFAWAQDAAPFLAGVASAAGALGLDTATGEHLGRLYGTEYAAIIGLIGAQPGLARRITHDHGCLDVLAQAVYAVTHEGARTLDDVIDRRLVVGTLGPVSRATIGVIADVAGPLWGWDEERCGRESDAEFSRRTTLERLWRTHT